MEKISVIIPIYKVEKYLEECIISVVNQDYKNLEIILVDDGSPDLCPTICDEWEKKDSRIKVIHKSNGGLSDARNRGIDLATGDFIGFVDSDDVIKTSMFSNLLKVCKKYKVDIACCGRILFNDKTTLGEKFGSEEKVYTTEEALKSSLIGQHVDVAAWDKLYKRDLFKTIRFPVGEINEDTAIYYKLLDKSGKIAHTGTYEYYYRCRAGSITQTSYRIIDRVNIFKHLDDLGQFIEKYYPSANEAFYEYRAVNIYYLMGRYLKSDLKDDKEYKLLKKSLKQEKKYVLRNKTLPTKDKIISLGMNNGLYKIYLALKGTK